MDQGLCQNNGTAPVILVGISVMQDIGDEIISNLHIVNRRFLA